MAEDAVAEEAVAASNPRYSAEKLTIERGRLEAYNLDDFVDDGAANKAKALLASALEDYCLEKVGPEEERVYQEKLDTFRKAVVNYFRLCELCGSCPWCHELVSPDFPCVVCQTPVHEAELCSITPSMYSNK